MYYVAKVLSWIIMRSFFNQIDVINFERIPLYGPVIFVGNHNNQFIDAVLLLALLPRKLRFLIAEKSFKKGIVGKFARMCGFIPVRRPNDMAFTGTGQIFWKGGQTEIQGVGTNFRLELKVGDKIQAEDNFYTVASIEGDTTLEIGTPASVDCSEPVDGVPYKIFPKIDQTTVYKESVDTLLAGNTLSIFPEGGSHDRTSLLPLKPGFAIMALNATLKGAENVSLVPLGLYYPSPHKLQGKAIIRFGMPIQISSDLAKEYEKSPDVVLKKVLSTVEQEMNSCLVTAQDPNKMKCINLCCSLYPPERSKLAIEKQYNLKQLFSKLFWECSDSQELIDLCNQLLDYHRQIRRVGINDDEIWMLKHSTTGATISFFEKLPVLLLSFLIGIPLAILWAPLRILASILAEKHRTQALASSSVKVRAADVVASYKVGVLLVIVPTFNIIYGMVFAFFFAKHWLHYIYSIIFCICVLPYLYFVSLKQFVTLTKTLRQLCILIFVIFGKINVWRDTERIVITRRIELQLKVRSVIDSLALTVSDTFLSKIHENIPQVILESDSKHLLLKKTSWTPLHISPSYLSQDEIL